MKSDMVPVSDGSEGHFRSPVSDKPARKTRRAPLCGAPGPLPCQAPSTRHFPKSRLFYCVAKSVR